ncbi:hypothetical protein B0H34DRAFT_659808, partial [Crassisporium funariophilum]
MSYSTKEEFFKVPKLLADGSNWVTYRDRLRWALTARGHLKHIDTVIPEPVDTNAGTSLPDPVANANAYAARIAMDTTYETRLQNYKTAEAVVMRSITSSVPDSVFNRIEARKTAKDVW